MSDLEVYQAQLNNITEYTRGLVDDNERLQARVEKLEADCEMKDKRIDWTVADNVKKAIRIEQLKVFCQAKAKKVQARVEKLEVAAREVIKGQDARHESSSGQVFVDVGSLDALERILAATEQGDK